VPTAIPGKPVGVADACAIAAVLFVEPEAGAVLDRLEGVSLAAPTLFAYELMWTPLAGQESG